jgi:hypothetical protein
MVSRLAVAVLAWGNPADHGPESPKDLETAGGRPKRSCRRGQTYPQEDARQT